MKTLLCLLIALVLAMSLTACTDSGSNSADDPTANTTDITTQNTTGTDHSEENTTTTEELTEDPTGEPTEKTTEPIDPEEAIVGVWNTKYYMTELNCGMEGFSSDAGLPLAFTFQKNGTVIIATCDEGLDVAVEELEEDLLAYRLNRMYETITNEGMTLAEADALFLDLYNMTVAEYVVYITEEEHLLEAFSNINTRTTYSVDGDMLTIGHFHLTFRLEGDTLTLLDCDDSRFLTTLGVEAPVTLTRDVE